MTEDDEEDYYASGNVRDDAPRGIGDNQPDDQKDPRDALMGLEKMDLLKMGELSLLRDLVAAIEGGYATPQEKAIFANLCKTNGLIFGDVGDNRDADQKKAKRPDLPEYKPPDYT